VWEARCSSCSSGGGSVLLHLLLNQEQLLLRLQHGCTH
jgi:hypothetical protein